MALLNPFSALHGVTANNDTICSFLQLASGWRSGRHKSVGVIGFTIAFTSFWWVWSDCYVTISYTLLELLSETASSCVEENMKERWNLKA